MFANASFKLERSVTVKDFAPWLRIPEGTEQTAEKKKESLMARIRLVESVYIRTRNGN